MKKNTVLYTLRLTLILLAITCVTAGLMGLVNHITADSIEEQTAQKAEAAMREVLDAPSYTPLEFSESDGITDAYRAGDIGYVVRVAPNGYGGEIDIMVGIYRGGTVAGVAIISHSETASLGANCTREEFRAQFLGESGTLAVNKDGGDIEALTGATVTSRAVTDGVNRALSFVQAQEKEAQG